ncbi:nuclear autoantigen Sp-100 [Phocoena phocoena]|uniref:nuclear autoantigen Sp-100 n=1 Tax=Phocoena phocoena TaxID=9742 RepID=UPI00330715C1
MTPLRKSWVVLPAEESIYPSGAAGLANMYQQVPGDRVWGISIENQNTDDGLTETVFRHFKRYKVEISTAIKKTFPFFEGLRDRELITNKMYEDCQDSCRNLVPVSKVVYNVLNELEKTFDLLLLEAVFSEVNRQEYPDLNHIYESFVRAVHEKVNHEESNEEEREERPILPLSLEQGSDLSALMSCAAVVSAAATVAGEQRKTKYDESKHDLGTTSPENALSDHLCETEQINAKRKDTTSDQNDALESQQANEQCAQESEPAGSCEQVPIQSYNGDARKETPSPLPYEEESPDANLPNHGVQVNSSSVPLADIKKEKPFFNPRVEWQTQARTDCNQAPDVIVISSEDSAESSDGDVSPEPSTSALRKASDPWDIENTSICSISNRKRRISSGDTSELSNEDEPQETSSSVLGNGSGTELQGLEKCSHVMCFSKSVSRSQEARTESSQALTRWFLTTTCYFLDTTDTGSNSTLGKHSEKRRRKTINTGPLKRGRKKGPRIPRETNVDFQLPELPVTCGEAKGILYKEKMEKGTSEKCIQDAYGKWFTLREFEIEGNHEASKNWKLSVRCGGWPLKTLIQREFLLDPSRKRKKVIITPENSNECEVCRRKTMLFSCDTCSRFFHETCHIPPKGADRNPWSCIFCKIKDLQERCPESQPCHQESEVLKKLMLPKEKVKCEFLLLKVYCSPKSSFFASEPYYNTKTSQGLEKPMWLNKIKKNLAMNIYHRVQEFVRDMRLIFQNYRAICKNKKLINLGLQLEAEFESDFKNVFGIQEISTNSNRKHRIWKTGRGLPRQPWIRSPSCTSSLTGSQLLAQVQPGWEPPTHFPEAPSPNRLLPNPRPKTSPISDLMSWGPPGIGCSLRPVSVFIRSTQSRMKGKTLLPGWEHSEVSTPQGTHTVNQRVSEVPEQ